MNDRICMADNFKLSTGGGHQRMRAYSTSAPTPSNYSYIYYCQSLYCFDTRSLTLDDCEDDFHSDNLPLTTLPLPDRRSCPQTTVFRRPRIVMRPHQLPGHGLISRMTASLQISNDLSFFLILLEVDRHQLETAEPPVPTECDHRTCNSCWKLYPQSLFPNWTPAQVKKSKIGLAIKDYRRDVPCIIHHVDVDDNGYFRDADKYVSTESTIKESWEKIVESRVSPTIVLLTARHHHYSGLLL